MTAALRFISAPKSPLEGVSNSAWWHLIDVLEVQPANAVSASGGLGAYDMRPRRLVELNYATKLCVKRTSSGRQVHVCEFRPPWTQERFLTDVVAQKAALSKSLMVYHRALRSGELQRLTGCSEAGALAILHIGGRGALKAFPDLFERTRALYEAAKGAF